MKKSKEEILNHLKNTAIGYTEVASGEIFGYLYGKEVIDIDDDITINGGLGTFSYFITWLNSDRPENMALEDYDMIISIADNLCKLAETLDSDEEIDKIVSQIDFFERVSSKLPKVNIYAKEYQIYFVNGVPKMGKNPIIARQRRQIKHLG